MCEQRPAAPREPQDGLASATMRLLEQLLTGALIPNVDVETIGAGQIASVGGINQLNQRSMPKPGQWLERRKLGGSTAAYA